MNRTFSKIWNRTLGRLVVASELASRNGKGSSVTASARTRATLIAAGAVLAVGLAVAPQAYAKQLEADGSGAGAVAVGASTSTGGASATGDRATALGPATSATRQFSTAVGNQSEATAEGALAVGSLAKATGRSSVAIGRLANANGATAGVEGVGNGISAGDFLGAIAIGNSAKAEHGVAIGYNAIAGQLNNNGNRSRGTAVGHGAEATGHFSVALGERTTATGTRSAALGVDANATGERSVAFGVEANARGDRSTALGSLTRATRQFSTAVGNQAEATAEGALAMGSVAKATGESSVAIGRLANATGAIAGEGGVGNGISAGDFLGAIAIGNQAEAAHGVAIGYKAVGGALLSNGNRSRGTAVGHGAEATGNFSVALGERTTATGTRSAALGVDASAAGERSVAFGVEANAKGTRSTAVGDTADATHTQATALGNSAKATADFATAVGNQANATRKQATALGNSAKATADFATAVGNHAEATGVSALAMGSTAKANADSSVALGRHSLADRAPGEAGYVPTGADGAAIAATIGTYGAVSVGDPNRISDGASDPVFRQITGVAAGSEASDAVNVAQLSALSDETNNRLADNTTAIAQNAGDISNLGQQFNTIAGDADDSAGRGIRYLRTNDTGLDISDANASQAGATAVGYDAQATAENALALGRGAKATAESSIAIGQASDSRGSKSIAIGDSAIARTLSSGSGVAIGENTHASAGVAIGSGAQAGSVNDSRAATAIGAGSQATGAQSLALGTSATAPTVASGTRSIAQGHGARATADNSVAIGHEASSSGASGVALGFNASATALDGVALGRSASATAVDGVALGSNSVAATASGRAGYVPTGADDTAIAATTSNRGAVSVGDASNSIYRQITGVAAGSEASDAVNVAQLSALSDETNNRITDNTNDIAKLGGRVDDAEGDIGELRNQLNAGGVGLVQQDNDSRDINVAQTADGDRVNVANANDEARTLTGLADGDASEGSRDAVTGGQLHATNENVAGNTRDIAENTAAIDGLDGRVGSAEGDINNLNTQLAEGSIGLVQQDADSRDITVAAATDGTRVDFTGTDGTRTLAGVSAGAVNAQSTDAINGSQLFGTSESVASGLGGGSVVNDDGTVSAPSYALTDADGNAQTVGNVGDALSQVDGRIAGNTDDIADLDGRVGTAEDGIAANTSDIAGLGDRVGTAEEGIAGLDGRVGTAEDGIAANTSDIAGLDDRVGSAEGDINNLNTQLADGSIGLVQQDADSRDITVAAATDGTRVDFTGTDGTRTLAGVSAGAVNAQSTDAINGSQLFGTSESVASGLGGGSVVNDDGTVSAPSYALTDADGNAQTVGNVGDALSQVDGRIAGNTDDIADLDGRVGTAEDGIAGLDGRVGTAEDGIAANTSDIAGLGDRVGTAEEGIAGLDGRVGTAEDGIAANTSDIAGLDDRVGIAEDDIAANTKDIVDNTAAIGDLDGRVDTAENDIAGLDDRVGSAEGDINNLNTQLAEGSIGLVQQDADSRDITVAAATDGTRVDFTGTDGTRTLAGISNGELSADSTDAVNGSQLFATNENVAENTTAINGLNGRVETAEGDIGKLRNQLNTGGVGLVQQDNESRDINVAQTADGDRVNFANANDEARTLTGLADGDASEGSRDAVTGGQLHTTNENVAGNTRDIAENTAAIDGLDGRVIANTDAIEGLDGRVDTAENDIAGLDDRVGTTEGDINNLNTQLAEGRIGLVQQDADSRDITVAAATDGTRVDFTGTDGTRTLAGVSAGAVNAQSTDAINGSQLFGTSESVASGLGGGSVVNDDGTVSAPSYALTDADGNAQTVGNVGDALSQVDGRIAGNTDDIADLDGRVGTAEDGIAANTSDIAGLGDRVGTAEEGIAGLDGRVGTAEDGIAANTSDIAGLDDRVGSAEGDINNLNTQLAEGSIGLVQQDADSRDITVAAATDGTRVDFTGTDGTRTLAGISNGELSADSTEAVNGSQLFATNENVAENTTAISGLNGRVETAEGDIGKLRNQLNTGGVGLVQQDNESRDINVAQTADGDRVNFANANDEARTLTGLADGDASEGSRDAVTGGQLHTTNENVAGNTRDIAENTAAIDGLDGRVIDNTDAIDGLGGRVDTAENDIAGLGDRVGIAEDDIAANTKDIVDNTAAIGDLDGRVDTAENDIAGLGDRVGTAEDGIAANTSDIAGLGDRVGSAEGDINNLNTQLAEGSIGLVQQDADSRDITVAAATDGTRVDFTGIEGARTLSGIRAGAVNAQSTDAINGSQLFGTSQSVASGLGGGSVVNEDGTVSAPSYALTDADGNAQTVGNVGDALSQVDGRIAGNTDDIADLDGRVGTAEGDIGKLRNQLNTGGVGLVQQDNESRDINVAQTADGDRVNVANANDEARTLTGLADGDASEGSRDAVTGGQLHTTNENVAGNTRDIAENTAAIDGLDGRVVAHTDAIDGLGGRVDTAESGIADNIAAIDGLDGRVVANTDAIDGLGGRVDTAESGIADNIAAIDGLDGRVVANTDAIDGLGGRVDTAESGINNLNTQLAEGSIGLVQQDADSRDITVAAESDGTRVDFTGSDGTRTLAGISNGELSADSTDAVNGSQLFATNENVAENTTAISGLNGRVETAEGDIGKLRNQLNTGGVGLVQQDNESRDINVAQTADGDRVNVANANDEARTLTGLADGDASEGSRDAVTGGQLHTTNENVAGNTRDIAENTAAIDGLDGRVVAHTDAIDGLGGRVDTAEDGIATNTSDIAGLGDRVGTAEEGIAGLDGRVGTAEDGIAANTSDIAGLDGRVGTAEDGIAANTSDIAGLDDRVGIAEDDINNLNTQLAEGSIGLVQQDADSRDITVAAATDGTRVDFTGIEGARTLSGIRAGAVNAQSTDAINGSQLFGTSQSVASGLGGGSVVNEDGTVSAPSYALTDADGNAQTAGNVGDALSQVDDRVAGNTRDVAGNTTAISGLEGRVGNTESDIGKLRNQLNTSGMGLVQQDDGNRDINVAQTADGDRVNFANANDEARTLTGLADGDASEGSRDAVTGGQLHTTNENVAGNTRDIADNTRDIASNAEALSGTASALGGGAHIDEQGKLVSPNYTLTDGDGNSMAVDNVGDALSQVDGRIAGNTTAINGLDGRVGAAESDIAANTSDIVGLGDRVTTNEGEINNLSTQLAEGSIGLVQQDADSRDINVAAAADGTRVDFTGSEGARTLAGISSGELSADSMEAVNGGQLHATNENVAGNATAIDGLDGRVGTAESSIAGLTERLNTSSMDLLQQDADSLEITMGKDAGGARIDIAGNDGARTLTGISAGEVSVNSTDAVSGSQLWEMQNLVVGIEASGQYSQSNSEGVAARADGAESVAVGPASVAAGDRSVAIGDGARADTDGGVSLGAGAVASREGMNGQREAFSDTEVASTQGAVSVGSEGSERQITHVAGGTEATDAVNVRQLESVQAGSVNYHRHANGSVDTSAVTFGEEGTPTRLHNIAAGVHDTDAVNVGQMRGEFTELNSRFEKHIGDVHSRIDKVERNANAGIAAVAAMGAAPYVAGKFTYHVGTGYHSGESAVGVNFRRTADNGRWSVTAGVAGSNAGATASVGVSGVIN